MSIFLLNDGFPSNDLIAGKAKLLSRLKGFAKAAPSPLLGLDFSQPKVQAKPTSATSLIPGRTASYIWTFEEAPGVGTMTDIVSSEILTGSGDYIQGQTAVGLWDGGSMTGQRAAEWQESATGQFVAAESSLLDVDWTEDKLIVGWFRLRSSTASASPFGKRNNSTGEFWQARTNNSGHFGVYYINDSAGASLLMVPQNHADLAWHPFAIWFDVANDQLQVMTDLGTDSGVQTGSLSNAGTFRVGVGHTAIPTPAFQIGCLAVYEGVEAKNFTGVEEFWTHGKDPTGKLTTATRAGSISVPVGTTDDGPAIGHFGQDQLPIGYHSALEGTGLGLYVNNAVENLIDYSEDFTQWTATNATVTAASGDAPDGFRSACLAASTAVNGLLSRTFTTTASTEYTLSVWIKRDAGSNFDKRLVFYDETNGVELASAAFTENADWQLITLTATTNVGQISSSLRVEIDTSGDSFYIWGAQANLGGARGPYARTEGAPAALSQPSYETDPVVDPAAGRIETTFVSSAFWPHCVEQNVVCTAGAEDLKQLWFSNDGERERMEFRDGARFVIYGGNFVQSPALTDQLRTWYGRWNTEGLPEDSASYTYFTNGVQSAAGGVPFTPGASILVLRVGANTANTALEGYIQRVTVYDEPGEEPNRDPAAGFTVEIEGLKATVSSTATDPDGSIVSTSYAWGDGTESPGPVHTYEAGGSYTIIQTVTDDRGSTGTASNDITVAAPVVFRTTTYEVTASDAFSGTSYTLTLNQDLAENYFVQIQGVGNADVRQYMSDSACRVGSDPFGTGGLGATVNPNELYLVRDAVNATPDGDWVGTIVVVECLDANSADGFALRDVVVTPLAELGGGEVFGTTAAIANVTDAGQVVPFGGRGGGGISTPVGLNTHATKTMGTLISVDSPTQITIERQTNFGYVADEATVTTYIVEWGSNWLVQAAEVVSNAGGAGVDSTAEYQTAALTAAPAANTVLFATGHDDDTGQGSFSSAMGLTVMMGDGVTVGDNSIAVGRASGVDELTALVYSMTHANLSVDWVFQSNTVPAGVSTVALTVPGASTPDTYGANYTEGRFATIRSATLVDQSNFNLREQVFGRLTDDTTLTWRPGAEPDFGGDGLAFWASVADFSGI